MTPEQLAAMEQALEALQYIYEGANNQGPHTGISWRCVSKKAEPAITAIREALADQQAHEEIERAMSQVWQDVPGAVNFGVDPKPATKAGELGAMKAEFWKQPAQPSKPWVGLTDEDDLDWEEGGNLRDLVKAIEAKLKEKNK